MGELVGEKANLSHLSGFLTFLAPHVHRDAHYKEDEPKHKAKDSSQHLSPGRIRLSLGRTDPTVSLISTCHAPASGYCLRVWSLMQNTSMRTVRDRHL